MLGVLTISLLSFSFLTAHSFTDNDVGEVLNNTTDNGYAESTNGITLTLCIILGHLNSMLNIIKKSKSLIALFVVITLSPLTAYADYDTAKQDYDERRFEEAFTGFTEAAEDGHMTAQYYLGVMYATGRTLPRDDVSAYNWFMKSALQGHAIAQGNIGTMKLNARGTDFDITGSYFWFILSEDGGFEKARKFMWRVTNYMERDDINSIQAKAAEWIKENRSEREEH